MTDGAPDARDLVLLDADVLICLACDQTVQDAVLRYLGDRGAIAPEVYSETAGLLNKQHLNPMNRYARATATKLQLAEYDSDALSDRVFDIQERLKQSKYDKSHLGESESMAIAEHLDAPFITNDRDARRVGADLGIDVTHVCALVNRAVEAGELTSAQVDAWRTACANRGQGLPC